MSSDSNDGRKAIDRLMPIGKTKEAWWSNLLRLFVRVAMAATGRLPPPQTERPAEIISRAGAGVISVDGNEWIQNRC